MDRTVMLFGLGRLGSWILEFLARSEGVDRIVTSDIIDKEWCEYRTNVAAVGSAFQGFTKKIEFLRSDVTKIDETAGILKEVKPNVIVGSLSLESPRVLREAPQYKKIQHKLDEAGFSVFLPYHLFLPWKLTEAIHKSGIKTHVVNCSFPDVVNPVIWKHLGYGPTVGAANPDLVVGNITKYVSMTEGVPVKDVTIYFVSSHAIVDRGSRIGVPFFLKILLGDQDITHKYDTQWLTSDCMTSVYDRVAAGKTIVFSYIAASAVKNVMAILKDTNEFTHAPGPNGHIGGYPIRLSSKGAQIVLPKELTLEQATKINEEGTKFDGIEKIENDGTVVFTDKTYSIVKELGYDHRKLSFDEIEARAKELKALTNKWLAS
jgi:hypothetical protein